MSEYCLQKRTLSHWSYVTWYEDLAVAQRNFQIASQTGSGYSWRLVEVTVVSEKLLDGEREPVADSEVEIPTSAKTPSEAPQPVKSDWGHPTTNWPKNLISEPDLKAGHASKGSVWVGNPTTKEKRRVPAAEAVLMLGQGWIKSGPRAVL